MKKLILISLVIFSFAYGDSCSAERWEYRDALICYKSRIEGGLMALECSNRYDNGVYRGYASSLKEAKEWLEKEKIDLEICLADS